MTPWRTKADGDTTDRTRMYQDLAAGIGSGQGGEQQDDDLSMLIGSEESEVGDLFARRDRLERAARLLDGGVQKG